MNKILVVLALIVISFSQVSYEQLTEEIKITKQLIKLYNQKLLLLQEIYNQNYLHIAFNWPQNHQNQTNTQVRTTRLNQKIILLKKLQYSTRYAQGGYLVNSNKILDVNTYEELGQFIGDILVIQTQRLTTLVGGKVGITSLKKIQNSLVKDEYLTGQDAEQMNGIWHRNINIREAEDVLIQWKNQRIVFRSKQTKQFSLDSSQNILNLISLNQYKILLVTNQRIATITRTTQITESYYAQNFSKISQATPYIVCADYSDFLFILLNTGQLARLVNQKVIVLQNILNNNQNFKLEQGTVFMQYIDQKLFIVHKKLKIIKIFNHLSGKFILNVNLHLPLSQDHQEQFQFYKVNGSIRLIISTSRQSNIYELLLPNPQETSYTPNYFKVLGVLAAIGCFIYFKMRKENNNQKDDQVERKGKNLVNYSPQIEQFLKKKVKEQETKYKKK